MDIAESNGEFKDKSNFEKRIERFPGFYKLIGAMDLLSNTIHEGKNLTFTFLYGEGDFWRVTQDVLSEEEPKKYTDLSPGEFAHRMEQHWSIFQGERVVGFIDRTHRTQSGAKEGIPLSIIVQTKPFSTIYNKLLKECIVMLDDALAVSTGGRGKVRIYYHNPTEANEKNVDIILWDTIRNEIEILSSDMSRFAKTVTL